MTSAIEPALKDNLVLLPITDLNTGRTPVLAYWEFATSDKARQFIDRFYVAGDEVAPIALKLVKEWGSAESAERLADIWETIPEADRGVSVDLVCYPSDMHADEMPSHIVLLPLSRVG
jgi:hypothetical protein